MTLRVKAHAALAADYVMLKWELMACAPSAAELGT